MQDWERAAYRAVFPWRCHPMYEDVWSAATFAAWRVRDRGMQVMFTAAKREAIDEARRMRGRRRGNTGRPQARWLLNEATAVCAQVPDRLVEDHHSSVDEFCADMPADVQLVVRRLAEGWRPNEIAAELGRTPGRVSQLIARARTGDRDLLVA